MLFPFLIALQKGESQMFKYFWEEHAYLWNEDTFEKLFKIIAKRELEEYIHFLFKSRTLNSLFEAMSYSYRF